MIAKHVYNICKSSSHMRLLHTLPTPPHPSFRISLFSLWTFKSKFYFKKSLSPPSFIPCCLAKTDDTLYSLSEYAWNWYTYLFIWLCTHTLRAWCLEKDLYFNRIEVSTRTPPSLGMILQVRSTTERTWGTYDEIQSHSCTFHQHLRIISVRLLCLCVGF